MLVCFFRLLTEIGSGFAFITKFSKIFVRTSPGAFDVLKVDVLNFTLVCVTFTSSPFHCCGFLFKMKLPRNWWRLLKMCTGLH